MKQNMSGATFVMVKVTNTMLTRITMKQRMSITLPCVRLNMAGVIPVMTDLTTVLTRKTTKQRMSIWRH